MAAMIIVAAASIGIFSLALWLTGAVSTAKRALATTQSAVRMMWDPTLDELERERFVQQSAITLVVVTGSIIVRTFVALAAGFLPILLADWAKITSPEDMFSFLERWDVIIVGTILITLVYLVGVRLWPR